MSAAAELVREFGSEATSWMEYDFSLESRGGALQQSWSWARYQDHFPDRRAEGIFELKRGQGTIARLSIISQQLPGGHSYLLLPRGPFFEPGADETTLRALHDELRRAFPRAVFARLDPPIELASPAAAHFAAMVHAVGAQVNPHPTTPTTTLLLDLSLTEEQLLAQMHPKGRYNIRVAQKHGVTCRTASTDELARAYPLFVETAQRTGISIHPESVYRHMLEELDLFASLEVAELDGAMVAAMITTRFAQTATYYYGASTQARKEAMAPYALQWHAIRKARANGDRWYDFLGIAPEGAGKAHDLAGVTDFKRKFGGIVRCEVEPVDLLLRPLLARGFHLARGLRRVLRRR